MKKLTNQKNATDNLIFKDILFYRKRICQITKEMCKGQYINEAFKTMFLNYAHTIVYYLKQLDEKDILQSDYSDLIITKLPKQPSLNDINNNFDINNILINKPKEINNLDNFVKKINVDIQKKFYLNKGLLI